MEVVAGPADPVVDRAGLRAGDVILMIDTQSPASPDEVQREFRLAQQTGRQDVGLLVVGQSGARWLPIEVGTALRSQQDLPLWC